MTAPATPPTTAACVVAHVLGAAIIHDFDVDDFDNQRNHGAVVDDNDDGPTEVFAQIPAGMAVDLRLTRAGTWERVRVDVVRDGPRLGG